jgi:hypothetical protein
MRRSTLPDAVYDRVEVGRERMVHEAMQRRVLRNLDVLAQCIDEGLLGLFSHRPVQTRVRFGKPDCADAIRDCRDDLDSIGVAVLPRWRFECCSRDRIAFALNGRSGASFGGEPVEQRLGGFSANDSVRDRISVMLEWIRVAAIDAALELNAALLLDNVRGLVSGGVKIRRRSEANAITDSVRRRAERSGRLGCSTTTLRSDM